jgi:hypothetical protein
LAALDTADKIGAKLGVNIKIIFDEFQDILQLADESILNKLRTVAQHHENLTYIFLGSIESVMKKIFENKSSPFFYFAKIMKLPPLDVSEIIEAAHERLSAAGVVDFGGLDRMIAYYRGNPDYTMQALQSVYNRVKLDGITKIENELLLEIMADVANSNDAYIGELISSAKRKKHHINVLWAIANNEASSLDNKTLYQVHMPLENMGLISKEGIGRYVINDILLQMALRDKDAVLELENGK